MSIHHEYDEIMIIRVQHAWQQRIRLLSRGQLGTFETLKVLARIGNIQQGGGGRYGANYGHAM